MKTIKSQKELQQIISEQQNDLNKLKYALANMERRIVSATMLAQRSRQENRRMLEHINVLERQVKLLNG